MSWSEARVSRSGQPSARAERRVARLVTALAFAVSVILTGCAGGSGFRPMYASINGGPALDAKLAAIDVTTIPGRIGQRVRNQLIFQTTGGGHSAPPVYRLTVTVTESITATLVKTTGEAASSIYQLDSTFTLVDIKSKKVLLQGTSHARSPFDRFPSIYANVRAREDAEVRASNTIAEDIKIRLGTFLSRDGV